MAEQSITIDRIELRRLSVPLKAPFTTSFGSVDDKDSIIVAVSADGVTGFGESVSFPGPFYNEESQNTIWEMLRSFIIPMLFKADITTPEDVSKALAPIRRNYMAISAIEGAVWDLYGRIHGKSLASLLGGTRDEIEVGVSIGIQDTTAAMLHSVATFLEQGYRKIKVKIKPGADIDVIAAIRAEFGPSIPLMADANSAYTLADLPLLKRLDEFGLMMIEQPLAHDDIIDHATLQSELATPVCLDESIHSLADVRHAVNLGSCRIVNIKIGRVGGLQNARAIHDLCQQHNIPVWCGGMIELGVGRAHNIAIASLPNFSIPGDTSASHRSFAEDIVSPPVDFSRPGFIRVPTNPGIGYTVQPDALDKFTTTKQAFTRNSL